MHQRHLGAVLGILAFVVGDAAMCHLQPFLRLLPLVLKLHDAFIHPSPELCICLPSALVQFAL